MVKREDNSKSCLSVVDNAADTGHILAESIDSGSLKTISVKCKLKSKIPNLPAGVH